MRKNFTAITLLLLPNRIAYVILNFFGHRIHHSVKIGWSWLHCDQLILSKNSKIGHLNLIRIARLQMAEESSIRSRNRMRGKIFLKMQNEAAIGDSNSIYRGPYPIALGQTTLSLGKLAIITSKHHLDCTCSISIGNYTTLSGFSSQLWTHGFYHADTGRDRIRIDGPIKIGNNVSVGSRCLFNPGVTVGNQVNVGGNTCVSKDLSDPGMYVPQSLRHIPNNMERIMKKLPKNENYFYLNVYQKNTA